MESFEIRTGLTSGRKANIGAGGDGNLKMKIGNWKEEKGEITKSWVA